MEDVYKRQAGFFRKNEKRLVREQRKLSRCVKGSRNYVRQKKKVARCHEKIRSQRRDYLHKLSRRITDQYDIEMCIRDSVTPWESVTPEVSDPTVRRELPKAGLVTGVKS